MKKKCLVLNRSFQPINTLSTKRAVAKLSKNNGDDYKVEVVAEYDEFYIHKGKNYNYPAIIVFKHTQSFDRNKKLFASFNRRAIWERDDRSCQYCSKSISFKEMTWDHVHPKSKGGQTNWTNLVTCCKKCNTKKSDLSLEASGMKLSKKPHPVYLNSSIHQMIIERMKNKVRKIPHESWKMFIFWEIEEE